MVKIFGVVWLILLVLLASACGDTKSDPRPSQEPIVTGQADGAPAGCSPDEIAQRMMEMFTAIGRGDAGVVDEFFGQKSQAPFAWYSLNEFGPTEGEKNFFVAYTWDELAVYLKERYQQHERLELRSIQFNGWDQERGLVHFGPLMISRYADDLQPGLGGPEHLAEGKGAYHCQTRAFVVLSLAMGELPSTDP